MFSTRIDSQERRPWIQNTLTDVGGGGGQRNKKSNVKIRGISGLPRLSLMLHLLSHFTMAD